MSKNFIVSTLGLSVVLVLGTVRPAAAQFYTQHNLVSDGAVTADLVDPSLVNSWGLASSSTSPWWVADNGSGLSTLYDGNTGAKIGLTVTVPGAPTGVVFNASTGFVVKSGSAEGPARFLFASEDGTISGWNPGVMATTAVVAVNNSPSGAVYKGLTIATSAGAEFLYATNFHNGTVDVFDSNFNPVPGGFADPSIPAGYAPFGIRAFDNVILVTYALQDADKHDDVPGEGHGYIDMFDTAGHLLSRVASKGQLNSPWGLALAPSDFGKFSSDLLVGNFGDGRIHAFDPSKKKGHGEFQTRGPLHSADGPPIMIDGLWALSFGNGSAAGPANALFFTAGPLAEQHGLFGKLEVAPRGNSDGSNNR